MVTNSATVALDAYTVETTQMAYTILKLNNKQKTTNVKSRLKSKLCEPRREILILIP